MILCLSAFFFLFFSRHSLRKKCPFEFFFLIRMLLLTVGLFKFIMPILAVLLLYTMCRCVTVKRKIFFIADFMHLPTANMKTKCRQFMGFS